MTSVPVPDPTTSIPTPHGKPPPRDSAAAFQHIVRHVFDLPSNSALELALADYTGGTVVIEDLLGITQPDIDDLEYLNSDGATIKFPPKHNKRLITLFQEYVVFCQAQGNDITKDWFSITKPDFGTFRVTAGIAITQHNSPSPNNHNSSSSSAPTYGNVRPNRPRDPVAEFRKGIKRDPSLFPTLKSDNGWDTYRRSLSAQADAQDVTNVLDSNYFPRHPDEIALFREQKKYMYAVFERTILTDKGKLIVRQHEVDRDAQAVFQELEAHATASTKALLDGSELLRYITSAQLGNGTWRGSTHSFILHWQDQIRLYESLRDPSQHFPDDMKTSMLQNAVHGIRELRQVKTDADQHKVQSGRDLSFPEYVSLVESAALGYDSQFVNKHPTRPKRGVSFHETFVDDDPPDYPDVTFDDMDAFDIDSPVDTIQAYSHQMRGGSSKHSNNRNGSRDGSGPARFPKGSRMPIHRWKSISPEAQTIWDSMHNNDKVKILALHGDHDGPTSNGPQVNSHQIIEYLNMTHEISPPDNHPATEYQSGLTHESHDNPILAMLTKSGKTLHPGDPRKVLSTPEGPKQGKGEEIVINGKRYQQLNQHVMYNVSNHHRKPTSSLIDRGANGGVAGSDVRVICRHPHRTVDIRGIDNHEISSIPIVTAGAYAVTQKGPVIMIMHQYAYHGKSKTIHSSGQLEAYQNDVNDKSIKVDGGLQRIKTLDGYVFPLSIRDGLPYLAMRPYSDSEFDELPHVIMTGDNDWDPTILDHDPTQDDDWYDALSHLEADPTTNLFDEFGDYRGRYEVSNTVTWFDHVVPHLTDPGDTIEERDDDAYLCAEHSQFLRLQEMDDPHFVLFLSTDHDAPEPFDLSINEHHRLPGRIATVKEPNYESMRPLLGWLPLNIVKQTFLNTTQYARMPMSTVLKKHYRSPNPACNVARRNEPVASDTVYSDTPAIDGGEKIAQFFCGTESLVCDAYGLKTDKQFINSLEDNVRERGAMDKLITDRAQVEISDRVRSFLRALVISSWQSEAEQQHQNPSERRYQDVKRMTNTLLDRTGSPAYTWLLCLMYVCFILNHTYNATIKGIPLQRATGSTTDISALLRFQWYEPVYYKVDDSPYPSDSREERGRFVGISENVGNTMTFKILSDKSLRVIHRSNVRTALDPSAPNLRLDPLEGEIPSPSIIKSKSDAYNGTNGKIQTSPMAVFDPNDLVGRTFLMDRQEDGTQFRAKIAEVLDDYETDLAKNPTRKKFRLKVGEDEYDEIMTYNEVLHHIEKQNQETDEPVFWKFRRIVGHSDNLNRNSPGWKGDKINVLVEWENGETTPEPLRVMAQDDAVSCALYAKDNGLLEQDGWKRFKRLAKRSKKMLRMINQAKLRSFRTAVKYMYGFEIPKDYQDAVRLDTEHGNTKWQDATRLEMQQLDDYNTFDDHGKGGLPPKDFKKIRVHLVYACKHDTRHKARLVANGNLTDIPIESVFSGVVSLRGLRMVLFLAELNGLKSWATDIGNAYLEARTKEKVYIHAGAEFGERQGHTLVIVKALYGLRTSGLRWAEKFGLCLREMGFTPSLSDPSIWMRPRGSVYEYIAVYVDDLAIASHNPEAIISTLENKYNFKLKGTGTIEFHLGCDFFRDEDGILCFAPRKYIGKLVDSYERMFGSKPKGNGVSSPLEKGDHPELDTSDLLDSMGIRHYQSLVGQLQWAISLGRMDITTAVMTMSSFRAAPRAGHLERMKRICGYLSKMRHAVIRLRTDEPDYSELAVQDFDWMHSVYAGAKEVLPENAPEPLGKFVTMTSYVDANLYHCMMTGRSVTGVIHMLNKTPIDWFSKKQATVETATYGSEFVAARTCVEQIMDLRNTLRYLGVPIRDKTMLFGDNESVVNSSVRVDAKLHKRHTMLSFHRVRECIASGMVAFHHLPGEFNPADILSKHWGYQQVWRLLQTMMFWQGDTMKLALKDDRHGDNPTDPTSRRVGE